MLSLRDHASLAIGILGIVGSIKALMLVKK
jgi:hypothetical protein